MCLSLCSRCWKHFLASVWVTQMYMDIYAHPEYALQIRNWESRILTTQMCRDSKIKTSFLDPGDPNQSPRRITLVVLAS